MIAKARLNLSAKANGPPQVDPEGQQLLAAMDERDEARYGQIHATISINRGTSKKLDVRRELFRQLEADAPLLASDLRASFRDEAWAARIANIEDAWNWARATAWIEPLCDPEAEQQLGLALDSARDRSRRRLGEIAAEKAWAHCFDRMTEHERQHLVAWSKADRSIGKGKGKYAATHRRNAREHTNECRSAIPA